MFLKPNPLNSTQLNSTQPSLLSTALSALRQPDTSASLKNLHQQRQELQIVSQLVDYTFDAMSPEEQQQLLGGLQQLVILQYETLLNYLKTTKQEEVVAIDIYETQELADLDAQIVELEGVLAGLKASDWSTAKDTEDTLGIAQTHFLDICELQYEALATSFPAELDQQLNGLGSDAQAERVEELKADYAAWLMENATLEDLSDPAALAELKAIRRGVGEIALERTLRGMLVQQEGVIDALISGSAFERFAAYGTNAYVEYQAHPGGYEAIWANKLFARIREGVELCEAGDYKAAAKILKEVTQGEKLEKLKELLDLATWSQLVTGLAIVAGCGLVAGWAGFLTESALEGAGVSEMSVFMGGSVASGITFAALVRPLNEAMTGKRSERLGVEDAAIYTGMFATLKGALSLAERYVAQELYVQAQANAMSNWSRLAEGVPLQRIVQEEFQLLLSEAPLVQQARVRLTMFGVEAGTFHAYGTAEAFYDQVREGYFNPGEVLAERLTARSAGKTLLDLLALKFANQAGARAAEPMGRVINEMGKSLRRGVGEFFNIDIKGPEFDMLPAGPRVPERAEGSKSKPEQDLGVAFMKGLKWLLGKIGRSEPNKRIWDSSSPETEGLLGKYTYRGENGITSGSLTEDTVVKLANGVEFELPAGTLVGMDAKGRLRNFRMSDENLTITIGDITLGKGLSYSQLIEFDAEGNLLRGVTSEGFTDSRGIKYMAGEFQLWGPKIGGNVFEARLAEDTYIDGIEYKGGTRINFNRDGSVANGWLAADTEIDGVIYAGGYPVHFNIAGRIAEGILAEGQHHVVGGHRHQGGPFDGRVVYEADRKSPRVGSVPDLEDPTIIIKVGDYRFKVESRYRKGIQGIEGKDGLGWEGELVDHTYVMVGRDHVCIAPGPISFYPSGKLHRFMVAHKGNKFGGIYGVEFMWGTPLTLYEFGSPYKGTLAKDTTIHGQEFKRGERVVFDIDGNARLDTDPEPSQHQALPGEVEPSPELSISGSEPTKAPAPVIDVEANE